LRSYWQADSRHQPKTSDPFDVSRQPLHARTGIDRSAGPPCETTTQDSTSSSTLTSFSASEHGACTKNGWLHQKTVALNRLSLALTQCKSQRCVHRQPVNEVRLLCPPSFGKSVRPHPRPRTGLAQASTVPNPLPAGDLITKYVQNWTRNNAPAGATTHLRDNYSSQEEILSERETIAVVAGALMQDRGARTLTPPGETENENPKGGGGWRSKREQ
jgi:hypothetical protein